MKSINLINPSQAHQTLKREWEYIKSQLIAGNKQVLILKSFEEALTEKQRGYYHGYILETVAKQAVVDGRKFPMRVWKEHYRAMFLGDTVVEITDIKTGATKKELRRVSSESLSVKGYNKLIDQVTADSATEFGVVFDASFDEWLANEE